MLGSHLRELPAAEQWQPIARKKSYEVRLPEDAPEDLVVIIDGKPMVTQLKDVPPANDVLNWAHYRKTDRMLMINTGDGNPAAMHKLQLARNFLPVFCL